MRQFLLIRQPLTIFFPLRFPIPGFGVYLFDSDQAKKHRFRLENEHLADTLFELKSKPMMTLGLCGPPEIAEGIVNLWVGDQIQTKVALSQWDKTESFLPEIRGVLKANGHFITFCMKVCTEKEKVSLLHHCDGFIIAFALEEGSAQSSTEGTDGVEFMPEVKKVR